MCFLKISSKTYSFKKFANTTKIKVYSVFDKGEGRNKNKNYEEFRISLDVSQKEWDDFQGQVSDTIKFLQKNSNEIETLLLKSEGDGFLDFPLYSRLDDDIVNQNDHLPKELIVLAGKLNLGIEMAIYENGLFEDDD